MVTVPHSIGNSSINADSMRLRSLSRFADEEKQRFKSQIESRKQQNNNTQYQYY
jgi:hypothetical protein